MLQFVGKSSSTRNNKGIKNWSTLCKHRLLWRWEVQIYWKKQQINILCFLATYVTKVYINNHYWFHPNEYFCSQSIMQWELDRISKNSSHTKTYKLHQHLTGHKYRVLNCNRNKRTTKPPFSWRIPIDAVGPPPDPPVLVVDPVGAAHPPPRQLPLPDGHRGHRARHRAAHQPETRTPRAVPSLRLK